MPWHRLPVLCWGSLASLLASPHHWHRVHRLFRYRILVETGAGGLAHCRNPAFHLPHHCQELIIEKSPKLGRFFLFILPIDKHLYLWYNLAGRARPTRPKFPLYTPPAILSIGKLHKFDQGRIPKVCAEWPRVELKKAVDKLRFILYNSITIKKGSWYNDYLSGHGRHYCQPLRRP